MDVEKLKKLGELRDKGVLSQEEFELAKAQLISSPAVADEELNCEASQENDSTSEKSLIISAFTTALNNQTKVSEPADTSEYHIGDYKSSTIGWLLASLSGWFHIILIVSALIIMINNELNGIRLFGLLLLAFVSIKILWRLLYNMAATYEITNQRLILKYGIIFKSIDEIELYRVRDVSVNFSLLNQIFNIGTIQLKSSDDSVDPIMEYIPDARDVRETIRQLVSSERRNQKVREIDIA